MSTTRFVAVVLMALGVSAAARAEMIETDQLLAPAADAQRVQVDAFLAREDVRRQLEELGVSPAEATIRVAGLTEFELQALSSRIDSLPAGGHLNNVELLLIILILIVLLI